jgi:hypothetical protein
VRNLFATLYGIGSSTWQNRKDQVRAIRARLYRAWRPYDRQWLRMPSGWRTISAHSEITNRTLDKYTFLLATRPPGDKKDIFIEMQAELGEECISESHFYSVWTEEFKTVRIPAQQRLGKCKTCDECQKEIVDTRDSQGSSGSAAAGPQRGSSRDTAAANSGRQTVAARV